MRRTRWILLAALAASAALAQTADQPEQGAAAEEEGVIDPRADTQLKRMSDYLGRLKTFRVQAVVVDELVTTEGQKVQELKQQQLTVARPNKLRIDRRGPNGRATLASDGESVVLINHDKNAYAKGTAPKTLDALVDRVRDTLEVDAPGGDFLVASPYEELIDGLQTGRYIGLEPIGDVMAHHLAINEKDLDWQIWIQDGEQPVPLRYVITSKDMPGHPQFTLELSRWEPSVKLSAETFTVKVPPNAKRIERATKTTSLTPAAPSQARAPHRSSP